MKKSLSLAKAALKQQGFSAKGLTFHRKNASGNGSMYHLRRPVFSSVVALCTVRFRQSKRLVQELLSTLLNVELSLGMICKIEQQTSEALATPVEEAFAYVQEQARVNADETGW